MNKLSLCLLLVLSAGWLAAQEMIFEYYQGSVSGNFIFPYETVVFPKGSEVSTYHIFMRVKKNKGNWKNVIQSSSFSIPKREWLKDTALTYKFSFAAEPGTYQAEMTVRNKALGIKRNLSKQFFLPPEGTEIGLTWLEMVRDSVSFIPSDVKSSLPKADKLILSQYFSLPLDSLRIALNGQYLSLDKPESPVKTDLKPILENNELSGIRVACFDQNIQYNLDPFLFTPWFSYSMRYSSKEQMEQLRYIANQNEWRVLSRLPESKYSEAIEGFWRNHDPSPETLRNETRESFCERVILADERYTIHKKLKGWKSDLGRIFIKYGEPDDIQSEVYPLGRYPNIIWTYYRENRHFIFADTHGFGQYTLRNKEDEY